MRKVTPAEFRPRFDFSEAVGDELLASASVGPSGDPILLVVDPDNKDVPFGRDARHGFASLPKIAADKPYPAAIVRRSEGATTTTTVDGISAAFPFIQPLVEGHTLIVCARTRDRGLPDQNAAIYNEYGQFVRSMAFGDGIEDVQVAKNGRIWVSYFDEGVFNGDPLTCSGLNCFDAEGNVLWQYSAPPGVGPIDDCYALNVAEDHVWACYYSDFPIVRIGRDFTVSGWQNGIAGTKAIATDESRVLLWGGYDHERDRCVIQTIAGNALSLPQYVNLRLPNGKSLKDLRLIGRGPILHVFDDLVWYQFDLRDI